MTRERIVTLVALDKTKTQPTFLLKKNTARVVGKEEGRKESYEKYLYEEW
jgi:hypothetical protein